MMKKDRVLIENVRNLCPFRKHQYSSQLCILRTVFISVEKTPLLSVVSKIEMDEKTYGSVTVLNGLVTVGETL